MKINNEKYRNNKIYRRSYLAIVVIGIVVLVLSYYLQTHNIATNREAYVIFHLTIFVVFMSAFVFGCITGEVMNANCIVTKKEHKYLYVIGQTIAIFVSLWAAYMLLSFFVHWLHR